MVMSVLKQIGGGPLDRLLGAQIEKLHCDGLGEIRALSASDTERRAKESHWMGTEVWNTEPPSR
jgi:hypothetical protein